MNEVTLTVTSEVMTFMVKSMEDGRILGTAEASNAGEQMAMYEKYPNCSFLHHGPIPEWFNARRRTVQAIAPLDDEIYSSFDARVWAAGFVDHVKRNPAIATDEETMTTWFASAIMRGYDEHAHRSQGGAA